MNDEMVLVVRLRVEKTARNVLRDHLIELFGQINDEGTFGSGTDKPEVMPPGWQIAPDQRPCVH
jgi:hypothetical protein